MSTTFRHGSAQHFECEQTTTRWSGPKQRAREALEQPGAGGGTQEQFLDHVLARYPELYDNLEWVRFHDFREQGFHYRIAVINVAPRPDLRKLLFQRRSDLTLQTGWYPLVQGSRANIPFHWRRKRLQGRKLLHVGPFGDLKRIVPIANRPELGTSFALEGTAGRLCLDFGYTWPAGNWGPFALRSLSHFHRDHSGGIWDSIQEDDSPIVLSRASLTYLWALEGVPQAAKDVVALRSILAEDIPSIPTPDGGWIEFFPVYHCPGAYGIRVTDLNDTSVTYLGDLCAKNGFQDFASQAEKLVTERWAQNRWVLLDAAMVGKHDQIVAEEDTPDLILERMVSALQSRNVFIVSDQPETLTYTCVQAFAATRKGADFIRLVLSPSLYMLLRALWKPVILGTRDAVDPLVAKTIGAHYLNFAESHRVYPLTEDVLSRIPSQDPSVILCSPSDIAAQPRLRDRLERSDVIMVGASALWRKGVPAAILDALGAKPRQVLRVASPDWSFHSDEDSLATLVRRITDGGTKVLLFHNVNKALRKFIRDHGLDPARVEPVSMVGKAVELV